MHVHIVGVSLAKLIGVGVRVSLTKLIGVGVSVPKGGGGHTYNLLHCPLHRQIGSYYYYTIHMANRQIGIECTAAMNAR